MKNLIRFMSQASLSMIGPCLARVLICVLAISSSAHVAGQGMGGGAGGGQRGGGGRGGGQQGGGGGQQGGGTGSQAGGSGVVVDPQGA